VIVTSFSSSPEQHQPIKSEYPLLGRDDVIQSFKHIIDCGENTSKFHISVLLLSYGVAARNQFEAISTDVLEYQLDYEVKTCIVIKGDTQQGKSRLLDEMFLVAHAGGIKCVKINLHSTQKRVSRKIFVITHVLNITLLQLPFSTSSLFVSKLLGFYEGMTSTEKENILLQSLFDFELNNYLWTLNSIFGTCFQRSSDGSRMSNSMEMEIQHQFLKMLCQKVMFLITKLAYPVRNFHNIAFFA
jgi:hypothetical protein